MAIEPSRYGPDFHCVTVSRDVFEVRSHYVNLRPVGGGSYGIVCSAEDTVSIHHQPSQRHLSLLH